MKYVAMCLLLSGCWAFVDHQNDEAREFNRKELRRCFDACKRDMKATMANCVSINVSVIDAQMCRCAYVNGATHDVHR